MTDNLVCENEGTVRQEGVYTHCAYITASTFHIAALVNPDDDLDGTFRAFDIDANEWLHVNGWQCEIVDYEEEEELVRCAGGEYLPWDKAMQFVKED